MWTELKDEMREFPEKFSVCEIKIDGSFWKGYNIKELFDSNMSGQIVFWGEDGQMAAVSAKEAFASKAYLMFEKDGRNIYEDPGTFRLVFPEEKYHRRWCREIRKYMIQGD